MPPTFLTHLCRSSEIIIVSSARHCMRLSRSGLDNTMAIFPSVTSTLSKTRLAYQSPPKTQGSLLLGTRRHHHMWIPLWMQRMISTLVRLDYESLLTRSCISLCLVLFVGALELSKVFRWKRSRKANTTKGSGSMGSMRFLHLFRPLIHHFELPCYNANATTPSRKDGPCASLLAYSASSRSLYHRHYMSVRLEAGCP